MGLLSVQAVAIFANISETAVTTRDCRAAPMGCYYIRAVGGLANIS